MANSTTAIIPEKYESRVQKELFKTPVFFNTFQQMQFLTDLDKYLQSGDTVNVRNVAADTLTVSNRGTLGADITLSDLTPANIQLSIDAHKYIGFIVNNIEKKQNDINLTEVYGQKAGSLMVDTIEDAIYTELATTTTSAGSAGVGLTQDLLLQSIQKLDETDVPSDNRVLVVSAKGKRELLNIANFVQAERLGSDEMIRKGGKDNARNFLGQFLGVDVYFSNAVASAASPTATNNIMYHKEALAGVIQMQAFHDDYVPMKLGNVVTQEFVYGFKLLDVEKVVKLVS